MRIPVLIMKDMLLVNVSLHSYTHTHTDRHPELILNYMHTNLSAFHSEKHTHAHLYNMVMFSFFFSKLVVTRTFCG